MKKIAFQLSSIGVISVLIGSGLFASATLAETATEDIASSETLFLISFQPWELNDSFKQGQTSTPCINQGVCRQQPAAFTQPKSSNFLNSKPSGLRIQEIFYFDFDNLKSNFVINPNNPTGKFMLKPKQTPEELNKE